MVAYTWRTYTLPGDNNIYFSRLRYASVALARNLAQIQIEIQILTLIKHYNYFFIDSYVVCAF